VEMYPEAKIVINGRKGGAAEWHKSIIDSIGIYGTRWYQIATFWSPTDQLHYRLHILDKQQQFERTGGKVKEGFFDFNRYEVQNELVREVAARHGRPVLEFEPGMGWEPLCAFLGKEVPQGVKFPRTNEAKQMQILKVVLFGRGLLLWLRVLVVPALSWWFANKYLTRNGWWS